MLKKLREYDTFGQPFAFNAFKDSGTFTTAFGGILTIIWMVFISAVSFVIIRDYLDTTKPVVSVNRIRLEKEASLDLAEEGLG